MNEEISAAAVEAASDQQGLSTGLGVDIVEISRMEQILERSPAFSKKNFSAAEQEYCERHHRPAAHYATHFAAKEAVLKALGTGFSQGIKVTDVEVTHSSSGRPLAVLHGRAKEIADGQGVVEISLSLSRSSDTAVANAVAMTQASRPKTDEVESPRQEIARRFKELRNLIDELDLSHGKDENVDAGQKSSDEGHDSRSGV